MRLQHSSGTPQKACLSRYRLCSGCVIFTGQTNWNWGVKRTREWYGLSSASSPWGSSFEHPWLTLKLCRKLWNKSSGGVIKQFRYSLSRLPVNSPANLENHSNVIKSLPQSEGRTWKPIDATKNDQLLSLHPVQGSQEWQVAREFSHRAPACARRHVHARCRSCYAAGKSISAGDARRRLLAADHWRGMNPSARLQARMAEHNRLSWDTSRGKTRMLQPPPRTPLHMRWRSDRSNQSGWSISPRNLWI